MGARYGNGGTRGRRITDLDEPLHDQPLEVSKKDWKGIEERKRRARDARRGFHYGSAATGAGVAGAGLALAAGNPRTTAGEARDIGRSAAGKYPRSPRSGDRPMKYNLDLNKPKPKMKASAGERVRHVGRTAARRPAGALLAGSGVLAAGGAGQMASARVREKHHNTRIAQQRKANAARSTTSKALSPRYYDPENRRQRRLGAAEAGSALGGAYAGQKGARGVVRDTKKLRRTKVRGAPTKPDIELGRKTKGAVALSRRNVGLLAAGGAGLGGAGLIRRHAETHGGRPWD